MTLQTAAFQPALLALAAALSLACSTTVAQEASKPEFRVKAETTDTGSNIRRDVAWGPLPYDKTYAELTPEQQRMFRSRFVQMAEGDEPPFPADGLGPLLRALGKAQETSRAGLGRLEMDVYVDAQGNATKVDVRQSPDARFSQHAGAIAMLTKFKPALCKGSPCAMGFPVNVNYVRR
jgi:hypothetical protein